MKSICTTLSLLLLSVAASAAASGTASELTLSDAALDALPVAAAWGDITGGSLTLSADGQDMIATITVSAMPEFLPGVGYALIFSDGERDYYAGAFSTPDVRYFFGRWDNGPDGSSVVRGGYVPGASGSVSAQFAVADLGNATVLSHPRAITADVKNGALPIGVISWIVMDEAEGEGEMQLPARETPAATEAEGSEVGETTEAASADVSDTTAPMDPAEPKATISGVGALAAMASGLAAFLAVALRRE